MAATVGVALLVQAVFLTLVAEPYLRREIENRGRDYALLTVREICEAYDTTYRSSVFEFRQRVHGLLSHNKDLAGVRIVDGTGATLFDSAAVEEPPAGRRTGKQDLDPWLVAAASQVVAQERRSTVAGEPILEIVAPYIENFGQHRLSAVYRIRFDSLRQQIRGASFTFLLLGAASVPLSIAVGLLLSRRITRPLKRLTSHVEGLTRGDFDRTVEEAPGAASEIRILAGAFNTMSRDLRYYVRSLAESYASLERVNSEIEARNAELERFTYTVSHDLKSPLITIRSYADFIVRDSAAGRLDRLGRDAGRIVEATTRMRQLLDDLLELSRIGRVANPPEEVAFGALAGEAAELVKGRLEAANVEVRIAPDLPLVRADRARLIEVLQNLIDNAAKFMGDQEHPRIDVGCVHGKDRVFFVEDNGIGIEERYHEKVFGLFEKLDPSAGGTGIGLALAKRIVEAHGGRIWVESEGPGQGTRFCFTLGG